MTAEPCVTARRLRLYVPSYMRISEGIKSLFRRRPPAAGELAARAETDSEGDQIRESEAVLKPEFDPRLGASHSLSAELVAIPEHLTSGQ